MAHSPDGPFAAAGAEIIAAAFGSYIDRFRVLTRAARDHFERCDWHAMQRDSGERLDLYSRVVDEGLEQIRALLGERVAEREPWTACRSVYARLIAYRPDAELAETFFNSITRRVFHTIGVDPGVEFVASPSATPASGPPWTLTETFERDGSVEDLIGRVLRRYHFSVGYDDEDGDARRIASTLTERLGTREVRSLELARSLFFRGKGAYIVGKVHTGGEDRPFLLGLRNPAGQVVTDALLMTENEVSVVFSFARSYFFVEMERPREMVAFLKWLMPRKPIAELYNAVGFNRHGKTELYRSLLHHLATSDDRFEIAPGQRGMVMCVFMLPGFDVVFKVIRDRFEPPKTVTHQEVRDKYRLVFRHDRAGRLVDAQEFEHLAFERSRFTEPVLEMLGSLASETVQIRDHAVVIRHLYTERRLRPLDVYLEEAEPEAAREAVIDYGQVLRDLAATNIFPGDMLLKNFGVSRHGRLIFYDYDELCRLTDCNFRVLPPARSDAEETSPEPWFYVGERDIFPEEFRPFLGLKGDLLQTFLAVHGELLDVAFWRRMQDLHRRGEVLDVYPYKTARRLRLRARDPAGREPSRFRGAEP